MTTVVARSQRCWEDVVAGEALAGFDLRLTETKIAEQVSGSQDFYAVHHDRAFARAGGHPDIFVNTGFTRAALSRLLTDYVGARGWVCRLSYEMRRMNRPGDVMKLRGKVVRKYVAPDGSRRVDLEVRVENDREGVTTPATATVLLPSRGEAG